VRPAERAALATAFAPIRRYERSIRTFGAALAFVEWFARRAARIVEPERVAAHVAPPFLHSRPRTRRLYNNPIVSIIDDDESVRVATSSLVRSLGWDVRLYASAEQFLASDSIGAVTCIISDVQMPGISGLDMYRRLIERGVTLPVIFISAFASDAVRRQALDIGAMCVLSKPVDAAEVSRRLETIRAGGDGMPA
jgi:CheY-like chemotaxis protein